MEQLTTFKELLSNPVAVETAEQIADQILADTAFAETPNGYKENSKDDEVSIFARCSTRPVIYKRQPGLAFSREENNVRKIYIDNKSGECQIKLYNNKSEFDRGLAPFSSYNIVPGQRGYVVRNRRSVYARVETIVAPQEIYIHMEWIC